MHSLEVIKRVNHDGVSQGAGIPPVTEPTDLEGKIRAAVYENMSPSVEISVVGERHPRRENRTHRDAVKERERMVEAVLKAIGDDFLTPGNHGGGSLERYEAAAKIIHDNYSERPWSDYASRTWALGTFRAALATLRPDDAPGALASKIANELAVVHNITRGDAQALAEAAIKLAGPLVPAPDEEKIREALCEVLDAQEALYCSREWSAWGHGTMSGDDFSDVTSDVNAMDELVEAVMKAVKNG